MESSFHFHNELENLNCLVTAEQYISTKLGQLLWQWRRMQEKTKCKQTSLKNTLICSHWSDDTVEFRLEGNTTLFYIY